MKAKQFLILGASLLSLCLFGGGAPAPAGAAGAKQVIKRYAAEARFLPFPGGEVDVDTPDDFSRLTAKEHEQEQS